MDLLVIPCDDLDVTHGSCDPCAVRTVKRALLKTERPVHRRHCDSCGLTAEYNGEAEITGSPIN
eukprot:7805529-Prorocentrum_lima.AAC.1